MAVAKNQIIEEFVFHPPGLGHPLHGRVIKTKDGKFGWEISHHCKPAQNAKIYHPSTISGDSAEEMENLLKMYAKNFTADFGVEKNLNY